MSDDGLQSIYDKSYTGCFYPDFVIGKPLPKMSEIRPLETHGPQTLFPYILFEQEGKFCVQCSQDFDKNPVYIVVFSKIKEANMFIDDLKTTFEKNFNFDDMKKPDGWKYMFMVHPSSTGPFADIIL